MLNIKNLFNKQDNMQVDTGPNTKPEGLAHVTGTYVAPRFNRKFAVRNYTESGYWGAAIDINSVACANGILRLHAKPKSNSRIGTKEECLYPTIKHNDIYQRRYIKGQLSDKPSQDILYKQMSSPDGFEVVLEHPVTDLFIAPNPMQSTYQFLLDAFQMIFITGDIFIHVVDAANGMPEQMYVLQSQNIKIITSKRGDGTLIDKYEYMGKNGTIINYKPEEIMHIRYPNPDDFWYGIGLIQKGFESFLLNKYSHQHQTATYANNGVPNHYITNKSGASVEKKSWFKKFRSRNRGPKRAGGVDILDGDFDIKTVTFSPKDLGDIKFNVQEISAVSKVPLNMLIGGDAIKANSPAQNINWLRNQVHPMMRLVASGLSQQLLNRYGIEQADAFLSFDNPVPEDRKEIREEHDAYLKNGSITNNEVRIDLGKEVGPEELDKYYYNGVELGTTKTTTTETITNDSIPEKNINVENDVLDKMTKQIDDIINDIVENEEKDNSTSPITINFKSDVNVTEEIVDDAQEGIVEQNIEYNEVDDTQKGISTEKDNINKDNLSDKIANRIKEQNG